MAINPMDAQGGIAGAMPTAGGAMPQGMPQGTPQEGPAFEQTGRGTVGKDLLDALVAAKLLREKKMAQNELMLSMENDPQTVTAKNEAELQGLTQQEVTKGVSGVLTKKNADKQKNMQRMAQGQPRRGRPPQGAAMQARPPQVAGIANNPRPNMAMMAQGGIVGFAEGQTVDAQIAAIKNSTTMSEEQKNAAIKQLYATEAQGQAKGLEGTRNFLSQNLNPAKLIGDGLGGINHLIGGGADLLASGANLANMPKIGAGLASFADKNYASGKKYIDKGMFVDTFLEGPDREVAAATVATPESNAKILQEEGRMQQGQTGGLPSVAPAEAPVPEGESYEDRRSRFARAGAMGGISGFAEAITDIETTEREQELEGEKVRLQAEYQQSIVDARSYNDAVKNLLSYNQELNTLISQNPLVAQAKSNLSAALAAKGGKGKNVDKARKVYDDAMKKAMVDIGNSVSGGSLLANIAALKEAVEGFRKNSGTTRSANVTASLEAIK